MAKYLITAIKITTHEIEIEADTAEQAYRALDDMISDDFENHIVDNKWDFQIEEAYYE